MKILIVNLGTLTENIVATSIVKTLIKKVEKPHITWCVASDNIKYIFDYNKNINKVISFDELQQSNSVFDVLVNLSSFFPHEKCKNLKAKNVIGYQFSDNVRDFGDIIEGNKENTSMNLFQMLYKLTGLTWRGEGYDLGYFPRSKSKFNRVGIAVAHVNLKNYIIDELQIETKKLWHIPYKKNIFKKMDQINKCKKIITDDILIFHLSMYLHKYVYFLQTMPLFAKMEFFGTGILYKVPNKIFR